MLTLPLSGWNPSRHEDSNRQSDYSQRSQTHHVHCNGDGITSGFMEPSNRWQGPISYPNIQHSSCECFQEFLDWLSQELGQEYAIMQIDRAPAHISSAICWPENIIPVTQPPHSPELNPPHATLAISEAVTQKWTFSFPATVAWACPRTIRSTYPWTGNVCLLLQLHFRSPFLCSFTLNWYNSFLNLKSISSRLTITFWFDLSYSTKLHIVLYLIF